MLSREEFKELVERKVTAERERTVALKKRNKQIVFGIGALSACLIVCLTLYPLFVSPSDDVYGGYDGYGGSPSTDSSKNIVLGDSEQELELKVMLEGILPPDTPGDFVSGNVQDDPTDGSSYSSNKNKVTVVITDDSDGKVTVYTLCGRILTKSGTSCRLTIAQYKKINRLIDKITQKER